MLECPLPFVLKHADALSEACDLRVLRVSERERERRSEAEKQGEPVQRRQQTEAHVHTLNF